jgi:hypothetical protein
MRREMLQAEQKAMRERMRQSRKPKPVYYEQPQVAAAYEVLCNQLLWAVENYTGKRAVTEVVAQPKPRRPW